MEKTSIKILMTVENICRDSTVGAVGTIGIMKTTGNIGTMDNLGTMETKKKTYTKNFMKVEKYPYEL